MKYTKIRNWFAIASIVFMFFSCSNEVEMFEANGTVLLTDELPCTCIIQLDDNINVVPTDYPESFTFFNGQRVSISYEVLSDDKKCNNSKSTLIHEIEEIEATPYVDLYFFNYDSLRNDAITVLSYELVDNILNVEVGYSGCSGNHKIDLVKMNPWCGTPPLPTPTFELRHNANSELCEMYVTEVHSFDISKLRQNGTNEVAFMFCYTNEELETMCDDLIYTY